MWFTETPWPPIIILLVVCCFLVAAWQGSRRGAYLGGVAVLLAACVGIFLLEENIVTDAELVEQHVHDLCRAFQRKDLKSTLDFFSPQAPEYRLIVEKE